MKKIMVMASVILIAGMSHALVALSWQSGAYTSGFSGPGGINLANSAAYTAVLLVWQDAGGTVPFNVGTGAQISDDVASATGAYTGTSASVFPGGASSYYAQMYLVSDDPNGYERYSQIRQLGTFTTLSNLSLNFATGAGFLGSTGGGSLWTGSTWDPIPEPTSLALLAVGLMAVGLRRRMLKK